MNKRSNFYFSIVLTFLYRKFMDENTHIFFCDMFVNLLLRLLFFYPCKRLLSSLFVVVWRHSFSHSLIHSSFCSFLLICLCWSGLFINLFVDQPMISAFATILPALYNEQSLLFFRYNEASAEARRERQGRQPEKKTDSGLSNLASSVTRVVIMRVSHVLLDVPRKKRDCS